MWFCNIVLQTFAWLRTSPQLIINVVFLLDYFKCLFSRHNLFHLTVGCTGTPMGWEPRMWGHPQEMFTFCWMQTQQLVHPFLRQICGGSIPPTTNPMRPDIWYGNPLPEVWHTSLPPMRPPVPSTITAKAPGGRGPIDITPLKAVHFAKAETLPSKPNIQIEDDTSAQQTNVHPKSSKGWAPTPQIPSPTAKLEASQLRPSTFAREEGTQMPQPVDWGAQASGGANSWPVPQCQPTMRVYTVKDLGFSPLNLCYQDTLVNPQLQMSILSPNGLPVSSNLTSVTLYIHLTARGELTASMSFRYWVGKKPKHHTHRLT